MGVLETLEPLPRDAAAARAVSAAADAGGVPLVHVWNDTARDFGADACVHALVEAQARRTPHAAAVACDGVTLTYAELDALANRAARLLRRHGVGPDVLVGVHMERAPELVVAMLAVLKAGGAYVPLDPAYPRARVEAMLADTRVPVLVTQARLLGRVDPRGATVLALDGDWGALEGEPDEAFEPGVTPENLSHVIYTSGSTGTPKGVQIRHAAVATLVRWAPEALGIGEGTSVLASTSVSFDVHVAETWVPLSLGARIVVVPNALHLASLPAGEPVEVASMVPSAAAELLRTGGIPPCVRGLNLGGEPLRDELAQALYALPHVERVLNLYGPTEDTTYSTFHVAARGSGRPMPVGRPVANTRVYLLDDALVPVADGETGEVWIAGDGLARGYLGRPAATAERFVPSPFGPAGARMYRTGDLGKAGSDGLIDCLGRVDHQVKVRGHRVELGEVEAALRRHPAVADAVAAVREDAPGDRVLVGYVVARDGAAPPASAELRTYVKERLPEYMVPSAVAVLGALPRLPNGKVDRGAHPPLQAAARAGREYVAPRTPAEETVCRIWEEVLGVERVGAEDDFFDLGGHSLRATQVTSRIRATLGARLPLLAVFEARTPAALARVVERGGAMGDVDVPPLVRVDRHRPLPLSFSQQAIWFFQELSPGMKSYNFQAATRFEGRLDVDALARALTEIVRRHEIFRTVFVAVDGLPRQRIEAPWKVELPVTDLRGLDEDSREAELERLLRAEFQKPFDLGRLPLIRWTLYRTGEAEHVLASVEHHFVHDGWSFGVYLRELAALYAAYGEGRESPLAEPEVQFADYAAWQEAWMRTPEAARQLAYWKGKLAGLPPALELPADRPRPAEMSFRGRTRRHLLPPELARAARGFAKERGVTLYMTLLAAFQALLHRYTGEADFAVGGGVANRNDRAAEGVIGMIVNTVAHRADLGGDPTVAELIGRVRATTFEAYAHRDVPFGEVVEAVQPERRLSHLPVYQVAFSFQDVPYPSFDLPGARMSVTEALSNESAKFDLQVISIPRGSQRADGGDEVTMIWEYATDLFDDATVARMEAHFRALLAGMIAHPEARVSALPLVPADERRTLIDEWSGRETPYPRATVGRLFAERAAAAPEAVALATERDTVTYAALDAGANRLARRLRALGVVPGTRVGLCLERSPEMVAATLAILKAGGAYVPLDPSYPAERLAFMLADTAVPVLVTDSRLAGALPAHDAKTVFLDRDVEAFAAESSDPLPVDTTPESVAYVMYTSGSTGTPKGIEVPHRALARLVRETDWIDVRPDDVFLQMAPASFDAATLEIWAPLLNGARLALYPAEAPSVDGIAHAVARHGVTVLWLTAGLFHLVVDERIGSLRGVRTLIAGGDVLSVPHVRRVLAELSGTTLVNGYGPTENTTFTCCHTVEALAEDAASVPIGRPIANTRVYVLDARMEPAPVGVPGELYAGGAGLALGYLNRPELTAEKFVADPFRPGGRLYRTGDRARWRPDGTLEFLGRVDAQVKVRGFRIEPGEVEAALRAHPAVADAVVVVRDDAGQPKRLVAYAVAEGADASLSSELRDHLRARLPEYMVPSAVVVVDRLPLTSNGKVDARALPAPDAAPSPDAGAGREPRDETERTLAALLAAVLRRDAVGVDDNFFDLGGDSILCMQLVSRAREAGLPLATRDVFQHQTVAAMAAGLRAAAAVEPSPVSASNPAPPPALDAAELDALLYALGEAGEEGTAA
ncbi:MAG TPA: amino acid adenylation domain-containing protein [Longimicrobium sp.]|nr:amino acid adenylation domain-containing protein [Longimicrobium sp.]